MKKRNAFTLVELLGVIVVLAILALITIPIISNVIKDVRVKALRDSAQGLIEASNLYYVNKGNNTNLRFDKNDSIDTLKELSYKGVVKEGTVIISKKGQVTVCITDGKNSAYKNYKETKVTTVKGKICSIKENSSIVYLDDEATLKEYDNSKLTELVNDFSTRISELENQMSSLKEETINEIYPIGSIYISTTDDTVEKVRNRFGGTWVVYGNGRTLMSSTDASEQTGGNSSYTYSPSGTVEGTALDVSQMPAHTHTRGTMDITGWFKMAPSVYTYGGAWNKYGSWGAGGSFSGVDGGGSYHPDTLSYSGGLSINQVNFNASSTWTGETSSVGGGGKHTHTFTGTSATLSRLVCKFFNYF